MTDYEMFSAHSETVSLLWAIFTVYVSIVFAFVIASHLAAAQLASRIVSLVIALYTLIAFWAIFGLNQTATALAGLSAEIKAAVQGSESSLDWHPAVTIPDATFSVFPILVPVAALAIYVGSLVFFFHQRKFS